MLKKAYLEITNVCNLDCSFCHKTKRPPRFMSESEFDTAVRKLCGKCEYLYFHLMGEPLLHPKLARFLDIAGSLGFKVILTTNGTLLKKREEELLLSETLYKISVSLHSFEANESKINIDEYLDVCFDFCKKAADRSKIAVLRLWNKGGADTLNDKILDRMHASFEGEWKETRSGGYKLRDGVYLEWGEHFEWPDINMPEMDGNFTCWGLRDQIGVLCDGSVVPCCLDADGTVTLGNIFDSSLDDILSSDEALSLKRSFESRRVTHPFCLRCGYAHIKRY